MESKNEESFLYLLAGHREWENRQMKCKSCGTELDLLEVLDAGRVFECSECVYTITLEKGFSPKVLYDGPPPLDFYFHD